MLPLPSPLPLPPASSAAQDDHLRWLLRDERLQRVVAGIDSEALPEKASGRIATGGGLVSTNPCCV
jgi:hypothetical protein